MGEELTAEKKQEMKKQLDDAAKKQLDDAAKKPSLFSRCSVVEVDGKPEATCQDKESARELADLLEKEWTIRVKPGKVIELVAPVTES